MREKILVTDSLFISDEHIDRLAGEGYVVERLDKPQASEDELIAALKGKTAYVLGGMELVTEKVLKSTDKLKVIAFTGTDWKALIPGWQTATEMGIAVSDAPGANSDAVAEFAMSVALAMQRELFDIGRTGEKAFATTQSIKDMVVGVVGAGSIGKKIINQVQAFGPSKIIYNSRSKKKVEAQYFELDTLLEQSDIVFIAIPEAAGQLLDKAKISKIKPDALLVSISPTATIDFDALYERLSEGTLRASIDWTAPDDRFNILPLNVWFNTNSHNAYNTKQAAKLCSDMAVDSLLSLLKTGEDVHLGNPEYRKSSNGRLVI